MSYTYRADDRYIILPQRVFSATNRAPKLYKDFDTTKYFVVYKHYNGRYCNIGVSIILLCLNENNNCGLETKIKKNLSRAYIP